MKQFWQYSIYPFQEKVLAKDIEGYLNLFMKNELNVLVRRFLVVRVYV